MRFIVMFVTAVCVLFLIKLRWPKKKNFYETENHFPSKVDNERSLAPQGSTNEYCSIYGVFLDISVYIQISYANCIACLPST